MDDRGEEKEGGVARDWLSPRERLENIVQCSVYLIEQYRRLCLFLTRSPLPNIWYVSCIHGRMFVALSPPPNRPPQLHPTSHQPLLHPNPTNPPVTLPNPLTQPSES